MVKPAASKVVEKKTNCTQQSSKMTGWQRKGGHRSEERGSRKTYIEKNRGKMGRTRQN